MFSALLCAVIALGFPFFYDDLAYELGDGAAIIIGLILYGVAIYLGISSMDTHPSAENKPTKTADKASAGRSVSHFDYDDSDNCGGSWDNSREAGGMPRDLSPFSDIDDPYDRADMEWGLFDDRGGGDFWD